MFFLEARNLSQNFPPPQATLPFIFHFQGWLTCPLPNQREWNDCNWLKLISWERNGWVSHGNYEISIYVGELREGEALNLKEWVGAIWVQKDFPGKGSLCKVKEAWYSVTYLGIWCEHMTHWKSPWCWEWLRAEGEKGVRGWDGWTASSMQWTWTWANYGRWWGTKKPGVLQSKGLQRIGRNWATEQVI